jgi:pilus assembly protein CpaE
MDESIRLLIVDDDPDFREMLRQSFEGHYRIKVSGMVATGREAIRWAEDSAPDAVIIEHGLLDMTGLEAGEKIMKASPGTRVFLMSNSGSLDLWRKAIALGFQDIITKPFIMKDVEGRIIEAVDSFRKEMMRQYERLPLVERGSGPAGRYASQRTIKEVQTVKQKTLAVISPKGGVGKTSTAVNMACMAASQSSLQVRTALVDLNEFGCVTIQLNMGSPEKMFKQGELSPKNILSWQYIESGVSPEELKEYMLRHHSGLWVVPAVPRPEQISYVNEELITKVITILKANFDFVIIDLPPSINLEVSWATVGLADAIILVVEPDVQIIPGMVQINEILTSMGVANKCYRVVNKYGIPGGLTLGEIDKLVPYTNVGIIRVDDKVREAVRKGEPLVLSEPDGDYAADIRMVTNSFFPVFAREVAAQSKEGLFSKLFKRKGAK